MCSASKLNNNEQKGICEWKLDILRECRVNIYVSIFTVRYILLCVIVLKECLFFMKKKFVDGMLKKTFNGDHHRHSDKLLTIMIFECEKQAKFACKCEWNRENSVLMLLFFFLRLTLMIVSWMIGRWYRFVWNAVSDTHQFETIFNGFMPEPNVTSASINLAQVYVTLK